MINKILLPIFLGIGSLGTAAFAEDHAEPTRKPANIVFILVDDLGWADIGRFGSTFYETPNIDRLAASGMRLTDAYAAGAVCSPTRVSLMTGKYPPLQISRSARAQAKMR